MNSNDNLRFLNVGLPDDIARRKAWGDFEGAIRLIDRRLAQDNIPDALRACLTAEREIMRRIPADYPLTRADALAEVRAHLDISQHSTSCLRRYLFILHRRIRGFICTCSVQIYQILVAEALLFF